MSDVKTIPLSAPEGVVVPAGHTVRSWNFVDAYASDECSVFDCTPYDEVAIIFEPTLISGEIVGGFLADHDYGVEDKHGRRIAVDNCVQNVGSNVRYLRPEGVVGTGKIYVYAFRKA